MAAALGSVTATLSVRIGDGEPSDIGTIQIPLTVSPTYNGGGDITIDRSTFDANLGHALADAAGALLTPQRILTGIGQDGV